MSDLLVALVNGPSSPLHPSDRPLASVIADDIRLTWQQDGFEGEKPALQRNAHSGSPVVLDAVAPHWQHVPLRPETDEPYRGRPEMAAVLSPESRDTRLDAKTRKAAHAAALKKVDIDLARLRGLPNDSGLAYWPPVAIVTDNGGRVIDGRPTTKRRPIRLNLSAGSRLVPVPRTAALAALTGWTPGTEWAPMSRDAERALTKGEQVALTSTTPAGGVSATPAGGVVTQVLPKYNAGTSVVTSVFAVENDSTQENAVASGDSLCATRTARDEISNDDKPQAAAPTASVKAKTGPDSKGAARRAPMSPQEQTASEIADWFRAQYPTRQDRRKTVFDSIRAIVGTGADRDVIEVALRRLGDSGRTMSIAAVQLRVAQVETERGARREPVRSAEDIWGPEPKGETFETVEDLEAYGETLVAEAPNSTAEALIRRAIAAGAAYTPTVALTETDVRNIEEGRARVGSDGRVYSSVL